MMHSTYTSSIVSLRTSFSFNGYSYYSNERCPSTCICSSCSISLNSSRLTVPINPNLSFGLRQSTLIQLPPSRRLILGSGDRPCFRSPVCNVGHHCCRESSCVHHYNVDRFVERNCKEDCCVKDRSVSGNQIKSRMMGRRNYRCSVLGDADVGAMISLLADDSNDECLDVKGRRRGLVEEERDVHNEHSVSGIEENVDQVRVQLSEEAHMKREEMRDFSREEDLRLRRRESSSSYITTSELGDFESDIGAQIKDRGFDGEASINHEKGPRKAGNSSTEWNCRKKSEKKLTAGSAQETESKKVSLVGQRQSHLSYAHDGNSMKASSWKKKLNYQEGESSSSVSFHEQSTCHLETENRVCGYLNCDTEREHLMQDIRNEVQSTINSQRISNEEESVMVVAKSAQGTGCKYCIQCGGMMQQIEKRTGFEQHSELSETQDDANVKLSLQTQSESRLTEESASLQNSVAEASSAHTKFESRTRMQEESSTSLQASAKEENGLHHQMVHVVTGEINNERKSEQYCEVVDSHRSGYAENDSRLQQQPETQMKNLEEYSTSLVSSQEIKGLQEESSYINIKGIESNKQSQAGLYASKVHSTNAEVNHQTISEQQIYSEQIFSTLKVKSEEELVEKHHQINEASVKSELRTETKGHILPVGLTGSSSGDMIVAQPLAMLDSQTDIEQISEGEVKSDLQISVVSPLYKFAEERPSYGELSISSIDNDHGSVTEIGTNLVYIQPQSRPESSSVEENSCGRKSFREHSPDDAVDSAKHKESMHIFGELVEKMTNEVSTSDSLTEKKLSEENLQQQNEEYKLKGPNQPDSVKISLQKQVPRGSSSGSGTNRSLDEMLGVKNHLPQNSAEKESLEGAASDDGVAKRTGKSLWSILAGIFRIRRGSRSETETSPSKSGGRNSSNESASNETWFSKYERDDTTGDSLVEKQQMSVPRKPTVSDEIPLGRNATKSWKGALGVVNSDEKIGHIGVGISSSSNALQTGLLLGVVSAGANTNLNISQPMPQLNPSLDLSRKPSRRLRRSHTSEKIEEVSQNERLVSSAGQTGVSASERRDGKLREQQLRHTDQVLQETFNKWENAIRHDKEQHKIDEFFMSEALIEAKKAADSWEVPIGAVLVQDGKIIARGYNLVEELRDATAHAEMICIREASSVLRSWRLSETTLYVTLEPCPMCAGAILQARIGTLVWGAPNKLLGADGSWIRLLPNTEGEDRPEVAHKPAAPVHPFHPKMKIRRGVLESECAEIMQQFFQLRRKKEEKSSEEMSQTSCLPIPQDPPRLLHKMHNILNIMLCL